MCQLSAFDDNEILLVPTQTSACKETFKEHRSQLELGCLQSNGKFPLTFSQCFFADTRHQHAFVAAEAAAAVATDMTKSSIPIAGWLRNANLCCVGNQPYNRGRNAGPLGEAGQGSQQLPRQPHQHQQTGMLSYCVLKLIYHSVLQNTIT